MLNGVRFLACLQLQWYNLVYMLPASPVDPYPCSHVNFSLQTKPWRPDVLLNVHKISDSDAAVRVLPAQRSITGAEKRNITNENNISKALLPTKIISKGKKSIGEFCFTFIVNLNSTCLIKLY